MDNTEAKLKFLAHVVKHGLQHLSDGGTALGSGNTGVQMNASSPDQGLVGSIGNALGENNHFQAGAANIQNGTNAAQLNQAYSGVQGGLAQQQAFTNALGAQGQQGMASQLSLGQQLQQQAAGGGPNPAQAALNQQTSQNIANQNAMAAGQRGASSNVGLMARQAAQQGAATQQQATGQGATLQAQQTLAAQGQLQNLAATQIGQQGGAIQGTNQMQQNEQNILQGANTSANNSNVAMQGNINNVNSGTAMANQQVAQKNAQGLTGMASKIPVVGSLFGASGGMVPGPQSFAGQWVNSNVDTGSAPSIAAPAAIPNMNPPEEKKSGGGSSPMAALNPMATETGAGGASAAGATDLAPVVELGAMLASKGGSVKAKKGQEATVKDDSLTNDKVPAMLSQGEIVIPRHIVNHPQAPEMAAKFVAAALAKRGKK